jgi:hypothetical protein
MPKDSAKHKAIGRRTQKPGQICKGKTPEFIPWPVDIRYLSPFFQPVRYSS